MVHVGALPGTPAANTPVELLAANAAMEARALAEAGFDAIIIENMHDTPYVQGDRLGPEVVAAMTRVALEVEAAAPVPIGVQILSGGARHALAVAAASTATFIRVENFAFAHVADEGLMAEAEAGPLLRYRRTIDAFHVKIYADIKKKHASHALTADIDIADAARAAEFFGADGLIVTGAWTGHAATPDDIARAKEASSIPLLVGSGVTSENVGDYLEVADAVIIGSAIKHEGDWRNPVDPLAAERLVKSARG